MKYLCAHCGRECDKPAGHVNRARERGLNLYCGLLCSGFGRRKTPKTDEQKKAEKAAYDAEYRAKNTALIKSKKAQHYQKNPNREREKAYRQENMARHVEYCRRPEYREYKREYDRQYRAKEEYGEFWECFLLSLDIRQEALRQAGGDYELRLMKGTLNKSQQRRRDYERLDSEEPQDFPLGNLERGERR